MCTHPALGPTILCLSVEMLSGSGKGLVLFVAESLGIPLVILDDSLYNVTSSSLEPKIVCLKQLQKGIQP